MWRERHSTSLSVVILHAAAGLTQAKQEGPSRRNAVQTGTGWPTNIPFNNFQQEAILDSCRSTQRGTHPLSADLGCGFLCVLDGGGDRFDRSRDRLHTLFPPTLAANVLDHVDIGVAHVVPDDLRPGTLPQHEGSACYGSIFSRDCFR